MKTSTAVVLGVLGAGVVGVVAVGNLLRRSIIDEDETEPSPCVADAVIHVSANPAQVQLGQSTVVSWSVQVSSGCSGLHVSLNGSPVAATGNRTVAPAAPSVFRVTASITRLGVYQETSASTSVNVTYPPRIVIGPSTPNPVAVLIGALASPNERQVIELCGVDLDFTGRKGITIGDKRSLIASPACARSPRNLGPRIFVRDTRGRDALFVVQGDSVLISGFRLEGPTDGIAADDNKAKGIVIAPFGLPTPVSNIEIRNMEVFHWPGLGVQVTDNVAQAVRGRLFNTNESAVRVLNNFFHHNRHATEGYGVEVSGGGYALIAQNVFNENRHGIAGGSKNRDNNQDFSGYTARDNLFLPGGGLACSFFFLFALTGWHFNCWHTHIIDMHGDDNRWYGSHNWQCGNAGETMIIQRNTILYTKGLAIKIRGNPVDKVVVENNVFKHGSRGDAIDQNGFCGWGDNITRPIDVRPNNVFGANPITDLGKCDFVGDGVLDDFMATGVTWWARSGKTGQWYYLNTMPEKLSQLSLERVDGDAICDVTPKRARPEMVPRIYSKSGRTPWMRVNVHQPQLFRG